MDIIMYSIMDTIMGIINFDINFINNKYFIVMIINFNKYSSIMYFNN